MVIPNPTFDLGVMLFYKPEVWAVLSLACMFAPILIASFQKFWAGVVQEEYAYMDETEKEEHDQQGRKISMFLGAGVVVFAVAVSIPVFASNNSNAFTNQTITSLNEAYKDLEVADGLWITAINNPDMMVPSSVTYEVEKTANLIKIPDLYMLRFIPNEEDEENAGTMKVYQLVGSDYRLIHPSN